MDLKNKLYVVGIGPGEYEQMTGEAIRIISDSDVIVGYTVYAEILKEYFPDKEYLTTPMTKEIERCELSLKLSSEGKKVVMVCSGDAGVYGMAGLILEIGKNYENVEVKVISGVTAATSGAAILGAPLIHDFVVISLSDRLTSWEKIARRLEMAAKGDFVICIYNPSSMKRKDYLQKACDIILQFCSPDTVCGYVKNIGREGTTSEVLSLRELRDTQVDMFTTVYIGNSQTKQIQNKMVTPRGYIKKEK